VNPYTYTRCGRLLPQAEKAPSFVYAYEHDSAPGTFPNVVKLVVREGLCNRRPVARRPPETGEAPRSAPVRLGNRGMREYYTLASGRRLPETQPKGRAVPDRAGAFFPGVNHD